MLWSLLMFVKTHDILICFNLLCPHLASHDLNKHLKLKFIYGTLFYLGLKIIIIIIAMKAQSSV